MTDITELAQRVPERKRHDWSQSVMRDCDFCNQWSLTVKHEDGARICASCCDAEYTSKLEVANSALVEALEQAKTENELARGQLIIAHRTLLNQQQSIADLVTGRQNLQQTMGVYVHAYEEAKEQVAKDFEIKARLCRESNSLFDRLRAAELRIGELERNEVREEGNQFLVVRHPGKVPVIKHPVGELEDYLRQILKADPLATIDIVTHRYYGVGGQFVEDADEYLHEMSIKVEAE